MNISVEMLHELLHETNRTWCRITGDDAQSAWSEAPEWQKRATAVGIAPVVRAMRTGNMPRPSANHEHWLEHKRAEGWTWGPVKDPERKKHPCMVPWSELPAEQRIKDVLYLCIIASVLTEITPTAEESSQT